MSASGLWPKECSLLVSCTLRAGPIGTLRAGPIGIGLDVSPAPSKATSSAWRIEFGPHQHEYFQVLSGRCRVTDDTGLSKEYGPGDSFIGGPATVLKSSWF
ncbi:MAG: DUF861 domain-containing protein [Rhodocyclaceae bacterium]|nr:DUF861 domain-containing protein [Rhodocyclaceae bacterium]